MNYVAENDEGAQKRMPDVEKERVICMHCRDTVSVPKSDVPPKCPHCGKRVWHPKDRAIKQDHEGERSSKSTSPHFKSGAGRY